MTIRIFSLLIALAVVVPGVQAALTLDVGSDRTVSVGEPVTITALFNETESLDTTNLSASVNWGIESMEVEIVPDNDHNGTIQATYNYHAAGTYVVTVTIVNNATGAVARDTLTVTVSPVSAEMKVVPRTVNEKSNGVMTVFISLAEWLRFRPVDRANATAFDPSEFKIGNATPERVNFCAKDGGTLILKYRQTDLNLAADDGNRTVIGNITMKNDTVPVTGNGAVSVINPGNGQRGESGNHNGHAWGSKEMMKNQKESHKEHPKPDRNVNGPAL